MDRQGVGGKINPMVKSAQEIVSHARHEFFGAPFQLKLSPGKYISPILMVAGRATKLTRYPSAKIDI